MNIFFVSLGCDKNLVDSEMMITSLRKDGFEIIDREEEADIIVVNVSFWWRQDALHSVIIRRSGRRSRRWM